jgi:hypothetical protein
VDGALHLRQFLTERRRRATEELVPALTPFDLIEARGVARGLVTAETLSQQEAETILTDAANEAAAAAADSTPQTHTPIPTSQPIAVKDDGPASLVRVVPLGHGRDPLVLGVDVWTTMAVLRLAYPGATNPVQIMRNEQPCTATDDLGNQYTEKSRTTSDAGGVLTSARILRPAPPPQARRLTVTLDSQTVLTVNLDAP